MEILDIFTPEIEKSCNMVRCEITDIFNSPSKIEELQNIPLGSRPIKDTFIMPAGGAVATRIFTRDPAPWLAHCHMEVHRQDGMAFIMNVGNYSAPLDGSWLPQDFPSCDAAFHRSQSEEPHCDCYIDKDAVLGLTLDESYKCSRSYTCMWKQSQVATLRNNENYVGYKLQSLDSTLPGWVIAIIFVCLVTVVTLVFTVIAPWFFTRSATRRDSSSREETEQCFSAVDSNNKDRDLTFWAQFVALFQVRWYEYRPTTINILRVIEVLGIGVLTGCLFQDVGKNSTATGLAEKTSLLFFSTTLWCQTRMYPAISNYFEFKRRDMHFLEKNLYDVLPMCLSRMVIVNACESWWPFLFVFCAYPLASMLGSLLKVFTIGIFLVLNRKMNCKLDPWFVYSYNTAL